MLTKLIILLIRLKLGVKKFEKFAFENQRSKYDLYYFTKHSLMKLEYDNRGRLYQTRYANVSLMWLLDDDCKIKKVD